MFGCVQTANKNLLAVAVAEAEAEAEAAAAAVKFCTGYFLL